MTLAILADIGGTNASFALAEAGRLGPVRRDRLDRHASAEAALAAWLADLAPQGTPDRPTEAVLAVAGPVHEGRARLTNRGWLFDPAALADATGLRRVTILNDFLALALSLPHLPPEALTRLGGLHGRPGEPMLVLGPGTGLGVAALLPPDRPLATEGGHATLPAHNEREAAVIAWLRDRFGHVSAERCLSGAGLANLHAALSALAGEPAPMLDPAVVTERALSGACPLCVEALEMFCAMLGGVAGDHALGLGATGGVFLGGGMLPRFPQFLLASGFRARFEAKGRFREWLAPVPTTLITHPNAALLGLGARAAAPDGVV